MWIEPPVSTLATRVETNTQRLDEIDDIAATSAHWRQRVVALEAKVEALEADTASWERYANTLALICAEVVSVAQRLDDLHERLNP